MRFKSLSEDAQIELTARLLIVLENAPEYVSIPDASPCNWLAAMDALNVRIAANGFLTMDYFSRVIQYVQDKISKGENLCTCCG